MIKLTKHPNSGMNNAMEGQFLLDIFGDLFDTEHSVDRKYFGLSFMVHLLVQSNNWSCFIFKSFHSHFDCFWVVVGPSACFSPLDQSVNQNFIIAFDKKETLNFEL